MWAGPPVLNYIWTSVGLHRTYFFRRKFRIRAKANIFFFLITFDQKLNIVFEKVLRELKIVYFRASPIVDTPTFPRALRAPMLSKRNIGNDTFVERFV